VSHTPGRVVIVRSTLGGAGYRISKDLVLTAAHVAAGPGTVELLGTATRLPYRRVWHSDELDIALLRLDDTSDLPSLSPARWGLLCSAEPCIPVEAHGFPDFLFMRDGKPRDYEQVDGHVNPLSGIRRHELHVNVDSELWGTRKDPWRGMSGGPVLCHGLLIGVTGKGWGNSARIAATPITEFVFDDGFREILRGSTCRDPVVEPADLPAISSVGQSWQPVRSWTALLRPTADVVPYRQGDDFIDLYGWVLRPGFDACLVHGDSGVGKTRLAYELVRALAQKGWAAAFADDFDVVNPEVRDNLRRLTRLHQPTLLVIDYAETRLDVLRELAKHMARNDGNLQVKLLLLARSAGTWWNLVRQSTRTLEEVLYHTHVYRIAPSSPSAEECDRLFLDAVHGFAERLPEITEITEYASHNWRTIAQGVTAMPDAAVGSPMSCQVAALTALLAAGGIGEDIVARPTREQLLAHERRYWLRVAADFGLQEGRGLPEFLDHLVTVVSLYGAHDRADALAVLARYYDKDEPNLLGKIDDLVVQILGRPSDSYWQPVQPSSLAEHLVVSQIHARPEIITGLLPYVRDYQLVHALTLLSRAAPTDHDLWAHVAEVATRHRQRMSFELLAGAAVGAPDSRGIAEVITTAHRELRPDQRAVVAAFTGHATTEQARRDLWNFYTQAYSHLPEAQLRRAASRAAGVAELLEAVRPGLTEGVILGMEKLPVVSGHLSTLYNAFAAGLDIAAATADHREGAYYEAAMNTTSQAREAANSATAILDELASYRDSFHRGSAVLDELGAALAELTVEIIDIRHRLDGLADDFGESTPN